MPRPRDNPVGRREFITGVGLSALLAAWGSGTEPHFRGARARFATFNIHHAASPHDVVDCERIAKVIEDLDVDVVGIQEIDRHWRRSNYVDQPQWFRDRLGMSVAFGVNFEIEPLEADQAQPQYGTAILSKWPIIKWTNTTLPRGHGHEPRGLMIATISIDGVEVKFCNTHLQFDDGSARKTQAQAVLSALKDETGPVILTGDMNGVPDSPAPKLFATRFNDIWHTIGDGAGYTHGVTHPHTRLDYIWASDHVRPITIRVADTDPQASDHLPVVAECRLTPP